MSKPSFVERPKPPRLDPGHLDRYKRTPRAPVFKGKLPGVKVGKGRTSRTRRS